MELLMGVKLQWVVGLGLLVLGQLLMVFWALTAGKPQWGRMQVCWLVSIAGVHCVLGLWWFTVLLVWYFMTWLSGYGAPSYTLLVGWYWPGWGHLKPYRRRTPDVDQVGCLGFYLSWDVSKQWKLGIMLEL